LFLQSSFVKDGATLEILRESQTRVKSIALIHEKLYRSTDLAQLDFGEYVRDLIADLFRTYSVNQEAVTLRTTIEDVFLQIDTAIPCGLIINELISNAFKHAFPAGTRGCVEIQLKPVENGEFLLTVRDDGVGLPAGFDWKKAKSFGLQLVTDLTSQMDGTVELNTDCGTLFEIRFRDISQVEGEAL
jgi:two-component sensor histidine kinase